MQHGKVILVAAATGALSAVLVLAATWSWFYLKYHSDSPYFNRLNKQSVLAVGDARALVVSCKSFQHVELVYSQPVIPQLASDPDHTSIALTGSDIESLVITEHPILHERRYWYQPSVEVQLTESAARTLIEAKDPRVTRDSDYRLEIDGRFLGYSGLRASFRDTRRIDFDSQYSFDDLASWLPKHAGCEGSPPAA
jgi:hypothetical protein